MAPATANRNHGWTVKITCTAGFFLLIAGAGCIGSAAVLSHNQNVARSSWTETTGRVRNCHVYSFKTSKSYDLFCDINYQLAGRTYRDTFSAGITHSSHTRAAFADWVARNGPETDLQIRVNPTNPHRFVVESSLPFHYGDHNPDDFVRAAIVMFVAGGILVQTGRSLIRAGW